MFIPIRTDSPLRRTPWMNWVLIGLNLLVFMLQAVYKPTNNLHLNPSYPKLYNFLTYAFLHADIAHLVGNMLFLYIFGNNVNDKLGNGAFLAFYLAGAVFSGVGYSFVELNAGGRAHSVIGASGAVAAVTGAYLVLFPRSHITVIYMIFFIGSIEIPSMWFVGLFFVQDLLFSARGDGVAHAAHIAGTVFGFIVCFSLLAGNLLPRDQFDVVALMQRWNRRRQYRDIVAQGYDPFGYARERERLPGPRDPVQEQAQELRSKISDAIAQHKLPDAAGHFLELKKLDPQQVLSRQAQLDIANQLASQQLYNEAADAYESFLHHYKNFEQIEQVELMLGLIYARYLEKYDLAKQHLLLALAKLHGQRQVELAKNELARIEPLIVVK
ncbi:MAG TPA: rhomboid family intramembrane serine protease [Tepidisphaeraceae bacterium]|jgi:membrane associated rhomboid family serine protease